MNLVLNINTHTIIPKSVEELLHSLDFGSTLMNSQVRKSILSWQLPSILQLEAMGTSQIISKLRTSCSDAEKVGRIIANALFPKVLTMEETYQKNNDIVELRHVFPFPLKSKMINELTIHEGCNYLKIVQLIMEQYNADFNHKILYIDSVSSGLHLNKSLNIDILERHRISDLESHLELLLSGEYGMVIINSMDLLIDLDHPGMDLATYSNRAIDVKRIMHLLKLYATRMNLFVIYTNHFNIMVDSIIDNEVKLALILRGGNIISYGPNNRIQLKENGGLQAEVTKSDYIPLAEYKIHLSSKIIDDLF